MGRRRTVARTGFAAALVILVGFLYGISDPSRGRPDDFVAFWAAARVHRAGGNPYDPAQLLVEERLANWTGPDAYRVWEPPWVLPLTMPFASLPYRVGRTLWFLLHLSALVLAAELLWRVYDGDPRRRGPTILLAFAFVPSIIAWKTGQLAPIVLLGLAGFLVAQRHTRDLEAGAFLALAGIKPHVVYLVWPAVLLWAIATRRMRVVAAGAATGLVLVLVASAHRPSIALDFLGSALADPPTQPASTFGTLLRRLSDWSTGVDRVWLNAVAPVAGLGWFCRHWRRRRRCWTWERELPLLVLVSLVTAPFAWIYDAAVATVAVVAGWAALRAHPSRRSRGAAIAAFVALTFAVMTMNVTRAAPVSYVWAFVAMLVLFVVATRTAPTISPRA